MEQYIKGFGDESALVNVPQARDRAQQTALAAPARA
jgi:hypothetical protein